MAKQLNHSEFKERQKHFTPNIVLVLENFEHGENIGSAFRLADAFGVKKIIIVTNKDIEQKKIEKTARSCTKNIPFEVYSSSLVAIRDVQKEGYTPISVEICDDSKPLRDCDFSKFGGVALIVGNERNGVSQEMLNSSEERVHIDMFGNNSSMNVSTALGIALYKACEDYYHPSNMQEQIEL